MANLLSIPENVTIQHLFPYLDHNDLLRLRRVSKQTKALADAYLWTPQPRHQGNWELKIDSRREDRTLQAFLQLGLHPPSRLIIVNETEYGPSDRRSFFEDDHLEEFMERYGKYVTQLTLNKLFFPFSSARELGFFESLVNLKELRCGELITVGGAAQFKEKTRNADGSFLIRPTFEKLTVFKLDTTDCMESMWNFINGVSNNLEQLLHPFKRRHDDELGTGNGDGWVLSSRTNFGPVRELIERRGMKNQSKLLYDWRYLLRTNDWELLSIFANCRDNGVVIKNLGPNYLNCVYSDGNEGRMVRRVVWDHENWGRATGSRRIIPENNHFVGSVIQSLKGVNDTALLMEFPALEKVTINSADIWPQGNGYAQWPNLRKLDVHVGLFTSRDCHFLQGGFQLAKLEELSLNYTAAWKTMQQSPLPVPRNLEASCGNVNKLTLNCCPGNDYFFLALWEGLALLEDVTIFECWKLTNKGFAGICASEPVFLKLEKLKRLSILNLGKMPSITDAAFKNVFRHLKLSHFKLSSDKAIGSISLAGINELLSGPFAKTIEKLDLDQLKLENVSGKKLKEVASCFRSSKML